MFLVPAVKFFGSSPLQSLLSPPDVFAGRSVITRAVLSLGPPPVVENPGPVSSFGPKRFYWPLGVLSSGQAWETGERPGPLLSFFFDPCSTVSFPGVKIFSNINVPLEETPSPLAPRSSRTVYACPRIPVVVSGKVRKTDFPVPDPFSLNTCVDDPQQQVLGEIAVSPAFTVQGAPVVLSLP